MLLGVRSVTRLQGLGVLGSCRIRFAMYEGSTTKRGVGGVFFANPASITGLQATKSTRRIVMQLSIVTPLSHNAHLPLLRIPFYHLAESAYDSVVILALGLVTLTPSCFARAMISIRFRAETACAILERIIVSACFAVMRVYFDALTLRRRSCCA